MIKISLSNFQFIKATKVPEKYLASSQGLETPKIFSGFVLQLVLQNWKANLLIVNNWFSNTKICIYVLIHIYTDTQAHTFILVIPFLIEHLVNWKTGFLVISHLHLAQNLK